MNGRLFDAAAAVMAHLWDAEGKVYDDLRDALNAVRDERPTCRHCGVEGEDTGGECPRCERNRDTGK